MMKDSSVLAGLAASLLVIYLVDKMLRPKSNAARHPLPPGPRSMIPLVGNLPDLPAEDTFAPHHWVKHKELYGPISSLNVLGNTLIVIHDVKIAVDLFEKQSLSFSSRPQLYSMSMIGWNLGTGSLPYNETLRVHRKNFARIIGTKSAASQFNSLQETEVAHFLLHLLHDPDHFEKHIQIEVGSVILKMVYGYNTEQFKRDPLLSLIHEVMEDFTRAATPGAFLVDTVPALRLFPSWFPGGGWKKDIKRMALDLVEAVERPYAFVESQKAKGTANLSYLSRLMDTVGDKPEDKHNNKWTAASLFGGGTDTTVAAISVFFLAMTISPDAQKKAQAEIDCVVGTERLPTLEDFDSLPYVDALVKEVFRWHPIGPMGLVHATSEETTYRGYRIPKDALLMPNIWWFTHDPAVYKEPMEFRPERFLASDGGEPEPDPSRVAFGFGRRVCPGRIFAEHSMFLIAAQTLAVFDIAEKMVDGKPMTPKVEFQPGMISHPVPFETSIKPRSPRHAELVESLEKTFPWQEPDATKLGPSLRE